MKSFVSIWIILLPVVTIDVRSSLAFTTTTSIGLVSTLKQKRSTYNTPLSILPLRYESKVISITTTTPTLVVMESSNRPQHSTTESHIHDDSLNEYIVDASSSSTSSTTQSRTTATTTTTTTTNVLGPTEVLLLQRHQMRQQGLRQDYGCTIKNDPYDYIRSVIWLLFKISNVIFPTLGVGLTIGLGLNLFCGLGYYYDTTSHTIVIDTLEHLRFQNQFLNSL